MGVTAAAEKMKTTVQWMGLTEGDTTGARRWRRKKRNKHLLEQTVLETQNDAQIPNALVLYVLGGAQRGDIHVVRNVASIGGLLSGADIELNDRYVSRSHAIIEYHDSRYWLYDNGSKWGTFVRQGGQRR